MQHGDFRFVRNICSTVNAPLDSFDSMLVSQRENPCNFMAERIRAHRFASTRDVDLHREEGRSYWRQTLRVHWVGASYNCQQIRFGIVLVGVFCEQSILTIVRSVSRLTKHWGVDISVLISWSSQDKFDLQKQTCGVLTGVSDAVK